MEAQLITAPGDGLAPAVLLSLPAAAAAAGAAPRGGAQYLFGAPEGLARFALEHRVRPGPALRAAFVADLREAGGLGGLLMRMRGEGHGRLRLLGPAGTLATAAALRHFVRWRHPALLVTEVLPGEAGECYADEHLQVAALWADDAPGAWAPPTWLAVAEVAAAASTSSSGESSGESSDESDDSSSSSSGSSSSSSGEDDAGAAPPAYAALDSALAAPGPGARLAALRELGAAAAAPSRLPPAPPPATPAPELWDVDGRPFQAAERAEGVSLFVERKLHEDSAQLARRCAAAAPRAVLAWLCRCRATGQLLVVSAARGAAAAAALAAHPAAALLRAAPPARAAGCLHVGDAGGAVAALADALPGPHIVLEHPSGGGARLGHLAALRAQARLALVSPRIFPLPAACGAAVADAAADGAAAADEEEGEEVFVGATGVRRVDCLTAAAWWPGGGAALRAGRGFAGAAAGAAAAVARAQREALAARPELAALTAALHAAMPELLAAPPPFAPAAPWAAGAPAPAPAAGEKRAAAAAGAAGASNKRAASALRDRLRGGAADAPPPIEAAAAAAGPEVLFLGTGCAEPSKHRGASAIWLAGGAGAAGRALLLDCGEGALGALRRGAGAAGAAAALRSLAAVWVSHRHADHMAGVIPLLVAYEELAFGGGGGGGGGVESPLAGSNGTAAGADASGSSSQPPSLPPLLLLGPTSLRSWLAEAAPPLRLRYAFAHCSDLSRPGHGAAAALRGALGLAEAAAVPARHCSDAWALVLRARGAPGAGAAAAAWSLAYSGDGEPSGVLAAAAAGATLLIHEATFEPARAADARAKRHSTTAEALGVAARARAGAVALTHFSQRTPGFPASLLGARAGVAFDGARVPLALAARLHELMPAAAAALGGGSGEEAADEEGGGGGEDAELECC